MEQERAAFADDGLKVTVPDYMKEIVAEITHLARKSPDITQRSGVSVRVSIANYENLLANAQKRSIRLGETEVAPRISDLPAIQASTTGKIEVEALGESREERVVDKLVHGAVLQTFNRHFRLQEFEELLDPLRVGPRRRGLREHALLRLPGQDARPARDVRAARQEGSAPTPAGRDRLGGRVRPRGPPPLATPEQGPHARASSGTGGRHVLYRYSRWDGSQSVDPFSADDLMDSLADDLMETGDLGARSSGCSAGAARPSRGGCPASRSCWTSYARGARRSSTATTSTR